MSEFQVDDAAADTCRVVNLPDRGRGVVTSRPLVAGQVAIVFRGPRLRLDQVRDFTHVIEIAAGLYVGPSGGTDDLVNHSCEPNCAVRIDAAGAKLYATRDIGADEELTFDYSTVIVTDPTRFPCGCGTASCRGMIGRWQDVPAETRKAYMQRGWVPPFAAAAVNRGDSC